MGNFKGPLLIKVKIVEMLKRGRERQKDKILKERNKEEKIKNRKHNKSASKSIIYHNARNPQPPLIIIINSLFFTDHIYHTE